MYEQPKAEETYIPNTPHDTLRRALAMNLCKLIGNTFSGRKHNCLVHAGKLIDRLKCFYYRKIRLIKIFVNQSVTVSKYVLHPFILSGNS